MVIGRWPEASGNVNLETQRRVRTDGTVRLNIAKTDLQAHDRWPPITQVNVSLHSLVSLGIIQEGQGGIIRQSHGVEIPMDDPGPRQDPLEKYFRGDVVSSPDLQVVLPKPESL